MEAKRPVAVTALGWFFIAVGALMVLSATLGLFASAVVMGVGPQREIPPFPKDAGWAGGVFTLGFRYFGVLAAAQIAAAVFTIVTAASFLKLKAWARTTLELLTWMGLAYVIGLAALWVTMSISMGAEMAHEIAQGAPLPPGLAGAFGVFGAVMGVVGTLMHAVPTGIVIWLLRSRTVRGAMLPAREAPPPGAA
jgi:hypothetical protein